jgi:uncharacterized protein YerC
LFRTGLIENLKQILKLFDNLITEKEIETFENSLKKMHFKKNTSFINEGDKNTKIGILTKGILKAVFTSGIRDEYVSRFYSLINKNIIVSNYESFFYGSESTEIIIAIENSIIMYIV